jgi:hypothetical protein
VLLVRAVWRISSWLLSASTRAISSLTFHAGIVKFTTISSANGF